MTANVFRSYTGKKVVGIPYKGRSFIYSALLRENLRRMPVFIAISAICAILLSSSFGMQINQGAWAGTFPGENGKIAFTSTRDGNFEIYVMNADGTNPTRLTNDPDLDASPSWSPDGEKIAFWSDRDDPNDEIYVMNADGTNPTRLTNNPRFDRFPSWSPDGEKIAFHSDRDGNFEIYVMNADDGSDQTNLSNNPANDNLPSWSPDGTKIAFWSDRDIIEEGSHLDIYVMNAADGSGQTRLTNNPAYDQSPNWSPDGTRIAFVSGSTGDILSTEIYVMNAADGSGQTRLTNNSGADFFPDWGPATATEPPEEDTTPPVLTVPEDIIAEATSEQGAEVTYTVTAQDNVDGNATLEEDGSTITQDDIGGDIDISCEPASGSVFPIGDTEVECIATDEAGNTGDASFTVTVNPPSPLTPAQEVIDELISTIQNLDDNVPQDVKTSLIALLNEISNVLNDNNPNNDESVCGTLDGFINQVNANETSDTLTADDADELSTQGEDIRNALDC